MGSVVFSIDAELGWGHHDLADPPRDRLEAGRQGWTTALELFDKYEIPGTWAIVGHLFLEDCDGCHVDHPIGVNWFSRERDEWSERPDLRFGPGLIAAIEDATVPHEIGSHTFSHVEFGNAETTKPIARAELISSLRVVDRVLDDAAMTSVVFPRNNIGHRDVLAEWGFSCYRGHSPAMTGGVTGRLHKLSRATIGSPPLVDPHVDEYGLVNVPASMYLFGFEGRARTVTERLWDDPIVKAVERGLDAVADSDRVLHLWFHPNNLVGEPEVTRLDRVLSMVAQRRRDDGIRVETMKDVSRRVTASGARIPASR